MAEWGNAVEREIHRRIKVSLWAYAYEVYQYSIVPDSTYDAEALLIDINMDTGNVEMDTFFKEHYSPHTGMWIHKHPQQYNLIWLLKRYYPND